MLLKSILELREKPNTCDLARTLKASGIQISRQALDKMNKGQRSWPIDVLEGLRIEALKHGKDLKWFWDKLKLEAKKVKP